MEIERLPEINTFFEVDPGLSNEWDLFWLMPEDKKVQYFEIAFDFRKNKLRYTIESETLHQLEE